LKHVWNVPIYILFGKKTAPESAVTIRLFTLILSVLVMLAAVAILAPMLLSSSQYAQQRQHIAQVQYENRHLTSTLSETEALLALRNGQIEELQKELLRNSHDMLTMKQRLTMFDDVLAARKVGGWHILHPTAQWQDDQSIVYHLVVVKGENYPRWAKGHLSLSVTAPNGDEIVLQSKKGKRSLQFDMTTHAFFEGTIPWLRTWQPKMLYISLFDKRGKNNQQIEIPILNRHALQSVKAPVNDTGLSEQSDGMIAP